MSSTPGLTPHIAALTREAQVRAGTQIAKYVWAGLEGSIVPTAINVSPVSPEVLDACLGPFVPACKMMGRVAAQVLGGIPTEVSVELAGAIAVFDPAMLVAATLDGALSYRRVNSVTTANVDLVASRHGIKIDTTAHPDARGYASTVRVVADGVEVASTLYGVEQVPRLVFFCSGTRSTSRLRRTLLCSSRSRAGPHRRYRHHSWRGGHQHHHDADRHERRRPMRACVR